MLISYYSISDFVALKYATIRVQKSIENAKKRVEVPLTDVLFSKSVSNKFITMQNVVLIMLLSC